MNGKGRVANRIVGYSIDERMTSSLAVTALNNALLHPGYVAGYVLYTGRGSQSLSGQGTVGPVGRVGAASDNAALKSFCILLQKTVLHRKTRATCHKLRSAMVTWIERTYHRRRRHARLGRLKPIKHESIMNKVGRTHPLAKVSPQRTSDP